MNDKKEKSYKIKVPVFTSEPILKGKDLFGGVSHVDMIQYVHKKVSAYKENIDKVSRNKRNKVQKKEIDNVNCIDCSIGDRPCVILQITAYNTNLFDGYVETDKKITLEQNNKIGSENFFVLLAPNIIGIDINNYKYQWIFLVYEDPHKETQDILSTVKLVINKILGFSTSNIKLPEILDELKRIKNIPELTLNFTAISNDENEVDVKYQTYLVGSKFRKQKEDKFENMPFNETEEVINDLSYEDDYQKRVVKVTLGKKEYRITRDSLYEAKGIIQETAEEIFNEAIGVTETELKDKIYDIDFIIEKLTPVLQNYLLS
ncbi:MAG: hypothetical protein JXJ22_07310 [Bacteroidales bacterium]|nr:hypothetical protein [Bacteroidales bacterium]